MRLLILMTALLLSPISFATCGPELEIGIETEDGYEYDNDSRWDREDTSKFEIKLIIPFSSAECDKEEAEAVTEYWDAQETKAETMEQMLRNFERLLTICRKNDELPICEKLDDMSSRLDLN